MKDFAYRFGNSPNLRLAIYIQRFLKDNGRFKNMKVKAINNKNYDISTFRISDLEIDQSKFKDVFKNLLRRGLAVFNLQLTDITFTIASDQKDWLQKNTVDTDNVTDPTELMDRGMSFFPALVYLGLPLAARATIKLKESPPGLTSFEWPEVYQAIFIVFFYAMTTANLPLDNKYVPQILRQSLGAGLEPNKVLQNVFNCSLEKLDIKWIREFPLGLLPDKFNNRLALATAGYRNISAFAIAKFKPDTPDRVLKLQAIAKDIVASAPDWNVHPIFRSNSIITKYGSINKSLLGLLAEHATDEFLRDAKATKLLYEIPKKTQINEKIFNLTVTDFNQNRIDLNATTIT